MSPTVYFGPLVNPKSPHAYESLPHALLAVSSAGIIEWIEPDVPHASSLQELLVKHGYTSLEDVKVVERRAGEFLIPGFIDTHTHAPQFVNTGIGQQYELLDWLENVTFPAEAKYADLEFARDAYKRVVRRVLDSGTTTCCYYGSLHLDATKELAKIVNDAGQRAFVGKCNMNRNSPANYIEASADASVADTKTLISYIHTLAPTHPSSTSQPSAQPLVQPVITPRFAISCTSELLASLGSLASTDPSLRIQTHISENQSEVAFTRSLFPECSSYADVYDSHGLLRHNTILAHGVYLTSEELDVIKRKGAGISHCPTSNFNLSSGVASVGSWLDRGIKVGLGTDVSGGFCPSILTAVQHASIASKVISLQPDQSTDAGEDDSRFAGRQLTIAALLFLATLGGAQVCDLGSQIGSFEPGKLFDALLIDTDDSAGNPGLWLSAESELDDRLEKFLFCGDDRNVKEVYVQGRLVGGTAFRRA